MEDLQSEPYWTASVRRVKTNKYNPVGTVSGGGWMEPIKAAKKWNTNSVYRIGRPPRCKESKE
jgi:hypothetical protein